MDCVFLVDIALNFRTAVVLDAELITDKKLIAKHCAPRLSRARGGGHPKPCAPPCTCSPSRLELKAHACSPRRRRRRIKVAAHRRGRLASLGDHLQARAPKLDAPSSPTHPHSSGRYTLTPLSPRPGSSRRPAPPRASTWTPTCSPSSRCSRCPSCCASGAPADASPYEPQSQELCACVGCHMNLSPRAARDVQAPIQVPREVRGRRQRRTHPDAGDLHDLFRALHIVPLVPDLCGGRGMAGHHGVPGRRVVGQAVRPSTSNPKRPCYRTPCICPSDPLCSGTASTFMPH